MRLAIIGILCLLALLRLRKRRPEARTHERKSTAGSGSTRSTASGSGVRFHPRLRPSLWRRRGPRIFTSPRLRRRSNRPMVCRSMAGDLTARGRVSSKLVLFVHRYSAANPRRGYFKESFIEEPKLPRPARRIFLKILIVPSHRHLPFRQ